MDVGPCLLKYAMPARKLYGHVTHMQCFFLKMTPLFPFILPFQLLAMLARLRKTALHPILTLNVILAITFVFVQLTTLKNLQFARVST